MIEYIKNKVLDTSIYFSFDRSGFERHQRDFSNKIEDLDFSGKTALITGASTGIGLEVAKGFFAQNGERLTVLSRTAPKNLEGHQFQECDLGNYKNVLSVADNINSNLDFLILNAGGMPEKYIENEYNHEQQFASQLMGHFILMRRLIDLGKVAKETKVIWTASGGMYLVKYNHSMLQMKPESYDKVAAYANVKRAQVILSEYLSEKFDPFFAVMHPGWVETDAVKDAIPQFYDFTKKRLRTPEQGADTILWLMGNKESKLSGKFWFDRKQVKKVAFPWTRNSKEECDYLFNFCEDFYQSLINER